jgi:DNA polymerase elongation subunit (family B)
MSSNRSSTAKGSEGPVAADPVLFGRNPEKRILAVQHIGEGTMRIYLRERAGVSSRDCEFYPFFFLTDSSYLEGFPSKHWIKKLEGSHEYRFLCAFTRWSDMWEAVHAVIAAHNQRSGVTVEAYNDVPDLHLRPDAVSQFLMQTGMTLFKGMEFDEVHRLQLDIETYTSRGSRFSNQARPEDRIILISLSDNRGWEYLIDGKHKTEAEMLAELARLIREKDPDVIEGHNIYNFDLPYIAARCRLHGIEFAIGRDGSAMRSFDSRTAFAERSVEHGGWEIAGRHIIDTWLLLQSYDVSKRALESYGLKYAAQYFGFAKTDRVYVEPNRISWYWDHDHQTLSRYALDDVEETRLLSDLLSPAYFYLARLVPMNYGTVARIGSAAKIEALILREYVARRHSVPKPRGGLQTTGGYTDIFHTGIMGPILDVDVESLYPSIMLSRSIAPRSETLGVFRHLLEKLTGLRLKTKRKMNSTPRRDLQLKYDAVQSSFKILINSFYGYLGYTQALFNDAEAADEVTRAGQQILRQLMSAITSRKGTVVMVDTDGVFFVPPPDAQDQDAERRFVEDLAGELPEGIRLAINGRYKLILSYKKKNYALLGYGENVKIKGSSLGARSIERFGRQYLRECIEQLLKRDIEALHGVYVKYHREITGHKLAVEEFARMEFLKENLEKYTAAVEAGERNRTASYEVAIQSGIRWRPGDRISYYITGTDTHVKGFENSRLAEEWDPNFPDENSQHYLKRLDELSRKFEVFFRAPDFRRVFSIDDLFPFSHHGIEILTQPVQAEPELQETEEVESPPIELTIWLDQG